MTLFEIFNTILKPTEDDVFQFSAKAIPMFQKHKIAKDKFDNPILLLATSNQSAKTYSANIKLQNVSVLFDINCKIEQEKKVVEGFFTAIYFIGKDRLLKEYFLKLCTTLIHDVGIAPLQEEVREEVIKFIELFRLATEPQLKTVQGLWAELFLINGCKDPGKLIECWHCLPEEKFDFNNGDERIEVKSSSSDLRIHSFSVEQLNPPIDSRSIVASIIVKQTSKGTSVLHLMSEIKGKSIMKIDLIEKLEFQVALHLGKSIIESEKLLFDFQVAKNSLRFYKAEDIPRISIDGIPPHVMDVHFKSDLSNLAPINFETLPLLGELYMAL